MDPETGGLRPQLHLDELLEQLQGSLDQVRSTRDRMHALLDAVMGIGGALDLQTVLRRITESAALLADAEYGALGVIGDGGKLVQFLTVGVDDETHALIGPLPTGKGILGLIVESQEPLRLSDLTAHPASYGFPPNHPPMHSFLGVPVRVRNEVFGNLYLTEKRGGGQFDDTDESIVTALAVAAGVAIENARLYAEARRRERWMKASADVTIALLSGDEPEVVLELIASSARGLLDADIATIALPSRDNLVVEIGVGPGAEELRGSRHPVQGSLLGDIFTSGLPSIVDDVAEHPRSFPSSLMAASGPALLVPLLDGSRVRGVLTASNRRGGARFNAEAQTTLEVFAGQASVALELAQRRREAEQLSIHGDRDRIARDLHDLVIQRLFAIGMRLESVIPLVDQPLAAESMHTAVEDLDVTIRDIRSTIYALQRVDPAGHAPRLRSQVLAVAEDLTAALGFAPTVRFDGLVDTVVPESVGAQILVVLREALTNAAKHARATRVAVALTATEREVALVVEDDGIGFDPAVSRRSGIDNISRRATELGGTCRLEDVSTGGAIVRWCVPLG